MSVASTGVAKPIMPWRGLHIPQISTRTTVGVRIGRHTGNGCGTSHATSSLSVYLHHGRLGALELALAVSRYTQEMGLEADTFLEELVVRRELAFNHVLYAEDPADLGHLPNWARTTLSEHVAPCYAYKQFENAATGYSLWNATQQEFRLRGTIHGYNRMYWGKKIVEWKEAFCGRYATWPLAVCSGRQTWTAIFAKLII